MHATVVTLFPDLFAPLLTQSVFGRAARRGLVRVDFVDLREHGEGSHRVVDDRPFGGGPGMVLKAEPVLAAVSRAHARHPRGARTIYLTPQGRRLDQALVRDLAASRDLVLLCGRYEGIDERAIELLRPEEVSIGDYVLSGGELAAMVLLDAVARLRPGVLGDEKSPAEDSFGEGEGLLDHPHYTRPLDVRGLGVPEVLRSGNHGAIARWRRGEALARTRARRPDLLGLLGPRTASAGPDPSPVVGSAGGAGGREGDSGGAGGRPPESDGRPSPPPPEFPRPFVPDPE